MSHVSPKARILSPPMLAYYHKAYLNASTDREITTLYSTESIATLENSHLLFLVLPPEPAAYFLHPQNIPLAIQKERKKENLQMRWNDLV